jgi:lysyl endopeptidase
MKINLKRSIAMCAVVLLAACGNNASNNTSNNATTNAGPPVSLTGSPLGNAPSNTAQSADAYTPLVNRQQDDSPMKARDMSATPVAALIALGAPVASQAAIAKQAGSIAGSGSGKPLQIGFSRDVAQTGTTNATKQVLKWQTTAGGGQVAAINFNSSGAKGLRIGLLVTQLPASATLRFYAKGAATAYEVKGAEVLRVLATNLAAGDKSDAGRTYWGPVVYGTDATLEIELPAGVGADAVDVSVPTVSHLFMSMKEGSTISPQANDTAANKASACQVDVTCTTPLPAASKAVVWLTFNDGGGQYTCSGTLLADKLANGSQTGTPYVLTANHCVANQTVASSLYSESLRRSTGCNSTNFDYFPTAIGGATLLYTAYNTESTLLRLYGNPAAGVLFAGWDASIDVALGTAVSSIHHPEGDAQRLSRGTVTGYVDRNGNPAPYVSLSTFLDVNFTTGLTEPGSSGAGLFKGTDANPKLIGQLYGGVGICPTTSSRSVFGRFDVAFREGMSAWLSPAEAAASAIRQPVYRFFIPQSGVYFYTIYASERDSILATLANVFTYEGIAFYASPTPTPGYNAITRFRNNLNGSYLYTISDVEKASILQNYPQYVLEGTAWYAEQGSAGGSLPLYRFRTNNGSHIYTAYESEKASILANYTSFVLEGPAYYVKLTP